MVSALCHFAGIEEVFAEILKRNLPGVIGGILFILVSWIVGKLRAYLDASSALDPGN